MLLESFETMGLRISLYCFRKSNATLVKVFSIEIMTSVSHAAVKKSSDGAANTSGVHDVDSAGSAELQGTSRKVAPIINVFTAS